MIYHKMRNAMFVVFFCAWLVCFQVSAEELDGKSRTRTSSEDGVQDRNNATEGVEPYSGAFSGTGINATDSSYNQTSPSYFDKIEVDFKRFLSNLRGNASYYRDVVMEDADKLSHVIKQIQYVVPYIVNMIPSLYSDTSKTSDVTSVTNHTLFGGSNTSSFGSKMMSSSEGDMGSSAESLANSLKKKSVSNLKNSTHKTSITEYDEYKPFFTFSSEEDEKHGSDIQNVYSKTQRGGSASTSKDSKSSKNRLGVYSGQDESMDSYVQGFFTKVYGDSSKSSSGQKSVGYLSEDDVGQRGVLNESKHTKQEGFEDGTISNQDVRSGYDLDASSGSSVYSPHREKSGEYFEGETQKKKTSGGNPGNRDYYTGSVSSDLDGKAQLQNMTSKGAYRGGDYGYDVYGSTPDKDRKEGSKEDMEISFDEKTGSSRASEVRSNRKSPKHNTTTHGSGDFNPNASTSVEGSKKDKHLKKGDQYLGKPLMSVDQVDSVKTGEVNKNVTKKAGVSMGKYEDGYSSPEHSRQLYNGTYAGKDTNSSTKKVGKHYKDGYALDTTASSRNATGSYAEVFTSKDPVNSSLGCKSMTSLGKESDKVGKDLFSIPPNKMEHGCHAFLTQGKGDNGNKTSCKTETRTNTNSLSSSHRSLNEADMDKEACAVFQCVVKAINDTLHSSSCANGGILHLKAY